ncbi:MAG: flagellar hook protein FlgE [Paludibacterium sp.]|uniref:flagellar hook protein FlgE n=1 Tax=Paludibacterium sp. TaxID=1917523 RepID=UPI0025E45558|nr:flagellar hook protein FlgE [Paludibacterium sp.]MBV8046985.1 flagellar hook protein FlgE [Paludibacterium sp.]MBV8647241.1 flagellar hook protein FlgE [Paludibacterium sp.]
MGFQQGLSGLNAASKQLDVIGNNIANANTVGFKDSRAEFGDMYANSFYGVSATQAGIGVQTLDVAQQMTQGNITTTNNNLDIAINNNGFFIVKTGASTGGTQTGTYEYTRNGEFQVDNQGYIVNNGDRLEGWPAVNGVVTQGALGDLQLQTSLIAPNATTKIAMGVNLDSRDTVPTTTPFSPTTPASYSWSNSTSVYDSLGNSHNLTLYYVKTAANTWTTYPYVDGTAASVTPNGGAAGASAPLTFTTAGALNNTAAQPWSISFSPTTGATAPETFSLNFSNSTQYGQNSGTNSLTNDGYAAGTVASISIDSTGVVQATYTNQQTKTIGQIALANFTNQQGLQPVGNNRWTQTFGSGPAQVNAPGSGTAGTLRDSALEASNVDLTTELVNLITAQRYYQANAQTIKAEDTIQQTLVNL